MVTGCPGGCRIGIMGGSFDPIHYGHLVLAEQVRDQFQLERIYFIPVGNAPHKSASKMSSKMSRYEMTVLATATNPKFEVSRLEIDRDTTSYAIDTVRALMDQIGPSDQLYFITGADAIVELQSWKNWKTLLTYCHFIGATRPGIDRDLLNEKMAVLQDQHGAKIHVTEVPALAISSTDIRRRVSEGNSIKYLLPESVEQYIYKNGLYKGV